MEADEMCGRYYIDDYTENEIKRVIRSIDLDLHMSSGDVHPSEHAIVLTGKRRKLTAEQMTWGFLQYNRKGLLINARAENVQERITFQDSIRYRRCVIPAAGFYEWSKAKEKAAFRRPKHPVLYMAGCYQRFEDGERFVILTTQANPSVICIHERMPLILEENELEPWIYKDGDAEQILKKIPSLLECYQEYEQQRLPFI